VAKNDKIAISNKIFEIRMSNYFISKDESRLNLSVNGGLINEITANGRFNMVLCLERFKAHWEEIYSTKKDKFLEHECRLIFLTYLKPILNGRGFYFLESALADDRRMDLVVIYNQEQFVVELKTWKGSLYNEKGVQQLLGYMDKRGVDEGYLLTFDFRKQPEITSPQWREEENGRRVFEVQV
jgi:hypothetical protein